MANSYLIKPDFQKTYAEITHGKGVFLYDVDGKAYLDASSGAVTASLGHGVTAIRKAIHEQLKKVSFVYRSQFTTAAAERLAAKKAAELLDIPRQTLQYKIKKFKVKGKRDGE